jgi:hypothetical protein
MFGKHVLDQYRILEIALEHEGGLPDAPFSGHKPDLELIRQRDQLFDIRSGSGEISPKGFDTHLHVRPPAQPRPKLAISWRSSAYRRNGVCRCRAPIECSASLRAALGFATIITRNFEAAASHAELSPQLLVRTPP